MRTFLNKSFLLSALMLAPLLMHAAETAAPAADKSEYSFNPVLIGLVSLILIMLFAIGMVANVLRQLSIVYREKIRAQRGKGNTVVKTILLLIALGIPAFHAFAAEADSTAQAVTPVSTVINGIPKDDFYLLMTILGLELLVIITLMLNVRILVRLIRSRPELAPVVKAIVRKPFWDRFNKAVAIEKEKDIMLDHDYDGIRELDNSLPPWWKYGFYITILFAAIYLYRYQVAHTAPNPEQEYAAEMKEAAEQQAAYLANAANNVDENSVKQLTDPSDIAAGKQIFESTCFPCHAKDGGGGVGPNLTDDYWLHGGSIKNVFYSIKYGWQDKGMKSWKNDFSPKQIAEIASYVKSLHGTHPAAPKEKQGELYIDGNAPKGADSTNPSKVAKS